MTWERSMAAAAQFAPSVKARNSETFLRGEVENLRPLTQKLAVCRSARAVKCLVLTDAAPRLSDQVEIKLRFHASFTAPVRLGRVAP